MGLLVLVDGRYSKARSGSIPSINMIPDLSGRHSILKHAFQEPLCAPQTGCSGDDLGCGGKWESTGCGIAEALQRVQIDMNLVEGLRKMLFSPSLPFGLPSCPAKTSSDT